MVIRSHSNECLVPPAPLDRSEASQQLIERSRPVLLGAERQLERVSRHCQGGSRRQQNRGMWWASWGTRGPPAPRPYLITVPAAPMASDDSPALTRFMAASGRAAG